MGVPPVDTAPMTIADFYAFTDKRPDEEKWELIDGEPVLSPSPTYVHQLIVANLIGSLGRTEREGPRSWEVLPGIGVRLSSTKCPQPDVLLRPQSVPSTDPMGRNCDDVIVAFEVLCPLTEDRDLRWKRGAYTELPSLTHYVVIAQDAVDVVVFARDAGFVERRFQSLGESVEFPDLGVSLALADVYRGIGLESS